MVLSRDSEGDEDSDGVDPGQHGVDEGRVDPTPLAADLLQEILEGVGHPGDMGHPDHRGAPLDGVGLAEERRHQLRSCSTLLQLQQLVDERVQPALRLGREQMLEVAFGDGIGAAHREIRAGLSSVETSRATASRASPIR